MLKTYLYIPDSLKEQINKTAQDQGKSKAEVIRQALENGINKVQNQGTASIEALLKLKEIGKKHGLDEPKDSSTKIDELLWSRDWSKDG